MTELSVAAEPATTERYGVGAEAPAIVTDEHGVIPVLLGHRSVRTFAPTPIGDDVVQTLVAAAQSASTSSNLQTWSIITVTDPAHKDRVATLAGRVGDRDDAPRLQIRRRRG